ncbi:MAG: hypothetical protein OXE85_08120 [Roseovarius sp.]|nr:hypothetical protein [Roseovarius sp.]
MSFAGIVGDRYEKSGKPREYVLKRARLNGDVPYKSLPLPLLGYVFAKSGLSVFWCLGFSNYLQIDRAG